MLTYNTSVKPAAKLLKRTGKALGITDVVLEASVLYDLHPADLGTLSGNFKLVEW